MHQVGPDTQVATNNAACGREGACASHSIVPPSLYTGLVFYDGIPRPSTSSFAHCRAHQYRLRQTASIQLPKEGECGRWTDKIWDMPM